MVQKTIYVVDDDPSILKSIGRLLKVLGFGVQTFSSAEEFWARANPTDAVCLVLDIHLGGASGIELRRQLLQSGSAVPVIFITGNDSETTRKAAFQAGCAAYLPKPFSANALVDGINRVLGVDADEVSSAPNNSVQAHLRGASAGRP
jgi:FixJ family two-component response regulator